MPRSTPLRRRDAVETCLNWDRMPGASTGWSPGFEPMPGDAKPALLLIAD
ncbi:MAG TPA: hypothetical protein VFA23_14010 [Dongiaceae bacterium]|nr:hypothetical protein [Dongiaceae bacterium]